MLTTSATPPSHPLSSANFKHFCGYCGCVFRVDITWQISYSYKAAQQTKTYSCPECRHDSRIKATTEPQITLISKRTDGRTGLCPHD